MPIKIALCVLVVLSGCSHSTPISTADEEVFTPTGEVQYRSRSAAFNESRVVGPTVNMARRADGSWGGRMMGEPVDVTEYVDRIGGANFTLQMQPNDTGEGQVVTGQWQGEIIRFELSKNVVRVRTGKESFTLSAVGNGRYGSEGQFQLHGQAANVSPPFPQFAFAMVGAFLSSRQSTPFGRHGGWDVNPSVGVK